MSVDESAESKPMLSDAVLVEGIRQGDETSFELLFHRHYQDVYRLLRRLVGTSDEAEELAQEVFIKLHQKPLRHSENVSGWLYRVATNLGYNALRGSQRRDQREAQVMLDAPMAAPSAAVEAQRRAAAREVRTALAKLKPQQGQLLLLRQMGFSYRELAAIVGVAPGSVGTLLARASTAFQRVYGGEVDEELLD